MALHPQAKALIARLEEQRRVSVTDVPVTVAREAAAGWIALQGEPDPVAEVTDTFVAGAAGRLPVRVYRPHGGTGPRPLLVYFHGGGWVVGGIEVVDRPLRRLANATGAVIASVGYRLAPETRFPGPVEDCYAALSDLYARAGEWGAVRERLVVAGDSAGGNLAAAVCLMSRDRGGPRITCQVLIYPVTAPAAGSPFASYEENADGFLLTRDSMLLYWDHYLTDADQAIDPYAAPLRAESVAGLPPALVLTAEYDPLRDEGEAYARRLQEAGVEVHAVRYDGFIHGFFWMPGALDAFQYAVDDITRELSRRFGALPLVSSNSPP
ncbi:alpha/beta hydrolase [Streptomyces sp. NPDC005077]|uniref:alpha/beta hydrolase n=1 Tax=Streptomyces sp. NPDC005077 TaxID=3154292 RepID=UPI0033B1F019